MIKKRKQEHIDICATKNVACSKNYFDCVRMIHCALPEINKKGIDISTKIFNSLLDAPVIITAITGGFGDAEKINSNLACAASKLGIGMGIGSQRAAIENKQLEKTYSVIKKYDVPFVIANIGAPQLVQQKRGKSVSVEDIKCIIEMIDADCVAVHLNFLQEIVQSEGETNANGCWNAIEKLSAKLNVPVILKETGAGISYEIALHAKKLNLGIDAAGAGGTSFAAVEYYRAGTKLQKRLGETFWDWGIPTPVSILNCKRAGVKPIIGSGGVRNGLDGAKAIALGSDVFGIALPVLRPALRNANAVIDELRIYIEELKTAMFLVGAKNIRELKRKRVILSSELADYL